MFAAFIFSAVNLFSQHSGNYAQYMFNALLINPAYAGSHDALNLTALYRNQWSGIDGAPQALSFGAHTPLKNPRLNLGFTVQNERVGLFNQTQANFMYAYRIKLFSGQLSFALQAGADNRSFDRDRLRVRHDDDPAFTGNTLISTGFVAGGGMYFHSKHFYAGIAVPAFLNTAFQRTNILQLHGGGLITLNQHFVLKPSVLLRRLPGSPVFSNIALTTYYKEILGLGIGYTHKNSFFTFVDIKLNNQMNFGYAFELSTGNIAGYNAGSHEIMLRYLFSYSVKAINPRYF